MGEAAGFPVPTEDERTLALLAHVLQLVSGFIGPLIIFVIKRHSRFVSFHSLQALIWQAAYACLGILAAIGWLIVILTSGVLGSSANHANQPPIAFFVMIPFLWLFFDGRMGQRLGARNRLRHQGQSWRMGCISRDRPLGVATDAHLKGPRLCPTAGGFLCLSSSLTFPPTPTSRNSR